MSLSVTLGGIDQIRANPAFQVLGGSEVGRKEVLTPATAGRAEEIPSYWGTFPGDHCQVRMSGRVPGQAIVTMISRYLSKNIPDIERLKLLHQKVMLLRPFALFKSQTVHTLNLA